jgi:cytochrome c peroxidase
MKTAPLALTLAALAIWVTACGSDDDPSGAGGKSGASGSGGASGTGGSSTGGSGGSGGKGASGGSGGSGGAGGSAGLAGAGAGGTSGSAGEAGTGGGDAGPRFDPYPEVPFPAENQFTEEKAILGKILFWEEQMSSDNTMACGTCHRGSAGGSDPRAASPQARHPGADGQLGTADDIHGGMGVKRCNIVGQNVVYKADPVFGTNVQVTGRKPPTYLDAMFASDIFWDGRAKSAFKDPDTQTIAIQNGGGLESQAVGPPLSDAEMACENRTWAMIHAKLQAAKPLDLARDLPPDMKAALTANPTYPKLFEAAFGTPEINTKRIAFAIATHERRLKSDQTPWDRFNAGETTALTPAQQRGFELFVAEKNKCTVCHNPPLFSDTLFHNVGFVAVEFDKGLEVVTGNTADKGKVKTPTVRNVGLREAGGLLHYGFGPGATLEELMKFYNVPPMLVNTDPQIVPLNLTADEITDMIDFMRHGLTDPRVQNELPPFDRPKLGSEP